MNGNMMISMIDLNDAKMSQEQFSLHVNVMIF